MDIFDIFITYVSWGSDGKNRPILVVGQEDAIVFMFNITTQYENKSPSVRAKYFRIADWREAGLGRQSYVDTNTVRDLPVLALDGKSPIGKLSEGDVQRLIDFLNANESPL